MKLSRPYDPLLPEVQRDPYPYYAELRDKAPIYHVESSNAWAVSRYEDVHHVFTTPELFSSSAVQDFLAGNMMGDAASGVSLGSLMQSRAMISADPPDHTRLRHLVNRGFTPRRIRNLEPRIREITTRCLDEVDAREEFDLMREFAIPLPVTVIAELLGVPTERMADFKRWSDAIVEGASFGGGSGAPGLIEQMAELVTFLQEMVESRKSAPRDDLITVLAHEQEGGALTLEEVILFAILLLVAGNETTTNLIGNTIDLLLDRPDDFRAVTADPSLIPQLVEEALRFVSPIQVLPRLVLQDTTLGGQPIRKGEHVLGILASANRDSRKFARGDEFDLHRRPKDHLAFGFGIHFCLGASLARLEARVALEELFARLPHLRRGDGDVCVLQSGILRGPRSLPVATSS